MEPEKLWSETIFFFEQNKLNLVDNLSEQFWQSRYHKLKYVVW